MIKVLTTKDNAWDRNIEDIPTKNKDIYHTLDYHKLHEVEGKSEGRCFVYEEQEKVAMYPFMLNAIEAKGLVGDWFDIETVYGYGGPIANTDDPTFLASFEAAFLTYCKEQRIIAEFVRFNPLLQNQEIFKQDIHVFENRKTVCLDLGKSVEQIWETDISSKNRNMIRKAQKQGLRVQQSTDYERFKEIYYKTMDKVDASAFYYFDDAYFNSIKESKNCTLLEVTLKDQVIAGGLFLHYGAYIHYHLSGSLREYLKYAPNNLLLMEAIKYGHDKEFQTIHFGGGLTNDPEDRLFKFKKSFSNETLSFCIGKRVHNHKVYKQLCDEWILKHPDQKPVYFLLYRQ